MIYIYISKRQMDLVISRGFYFHETLFRENKPLRTFPNLQYLNLLKDRTNNVLLLIQDHALLLMCLNFKLIASTMFKWASMQVLSKVCLKKGSNQPA